MTQTLAYGIRALRATLFLLLLPAAMQAQEIEQLTSFQSESARLNYVDQLVAFNGNIYTANRSLFGTEKGRFSRIDPATGTFAPLGEENNFRDISGADRIFGSFQELDGMLFGRSQVDGAGTDLFRIAGDSSIRLTNLANYPMSQLVPFAGQYYFLVAGRSSGATPVGQSPFSYTELWRSDGTPEGTVFVEELPITNSSSFFRDRQTLVAGAESLLISGNPADQSNSLYMRYFLYRPGGVVTQVELPDNSDYTTPALQHNDETNPEVVFFAGGFYLSGRIEGSVDSGPEIFRIDEAEGTLRVIPGLLVNASGQSLGEDASYAIVGDSLYLHTANLNAGYALYVAGPATPGQFRSVASSDLPSAESGVVVYRDTLYFGGAGGGVQPAILRYVPGSAAPEVLFSNPDGQLQANLYVGEDVIYAVSQFNQQRLLRYRPSLDSLTAFSNFLSRVYGRQRYVADLFGNDLIYVGYTETSGSGPVETEPYILERGAAKPRVLAPIEPAPPTGVFSAVSETSDGRVLFYGADGDSPRRYHLYDPVAETVTDLRFNFPGLEVNPPQYLNTIDGQAIFTSYSYNVNAYFLFTLRGDSLYLLSDATTNTTFTLEDSYFLTRGQVELDNQYQYVDLYYHTFTDSTATRELIRRLNGIYNLTTSGSEYIQLVNLGDEVNSGTLLKSDGTILYDFVTPREAEMIFADSAGYYLLIYPSGGEPSFEYHYADGSTPVSFSFPDGVTPGVRFPEYVLGQRLIFFPYNRAGGIEPYVADPATGRIELLRDINPGAAGSAPANFRRVGNRLFFAADDGVNGVELWRTDGTVAGTYLLQDINPGKAPSLPVPLYLGDSTLYFAATGESGQEAYGIRLEDEVVRLIADINPGPGGSYPRSFLEVDSALYVVASPGGNVAPQLIRITKGVLSPVREDPRPEGAMRLFPNPAAGSVTVLAEPGELLDRIRLYDGSGRLLRDERTRSERYNLPLQNLAPGRYVTVVQYVSGGRRVSPLVVVR